MIARLIGPTSFAPRMALFYTAVFGAVGIYIPFFPLWLESRALTAAEIGLVLAVPMAVRAVVTPLMVSFGDRVSDRRSITMLYASLAFVFLGFLFAANGFWQIVCVVVCVAIFWDTLVPLGDAIALSGVRKFGMDYGKVRLWGSVSFVGANIAAGALISALSGSVVLPVLFVAYGLVALSTVMLPKGEVAGNHPPDSQTVTSPHALRHPVLLLSLAIGALCQSSHAMLYAFGSLYWQKSGFSGLEIGVLWAVGVLAEVALFALSKPVLKRLGPSGLLAVGAVSVILRWLLFPIHWSFSGYLVLQILHGATFGAAHLGVMHSISRRVPDAQTGRAQATYFFISGVMMAFMTIMSGQLFVRFGVDSFTVMALLGVVAFGLWGLMQRLGKRSASPP